MHDVYVQRVVRNAGHEMALGYAIHAWDPGNNAGQKLDDGWVAVEGLASFRVDDDVWGSVPLEDDVTFPLVVDEGTFKLWCAIGKCQPARLSSARVGWRRGQ